MGLKQRLAEFGFESADDFEFPLRLAFEAQIEHLRTLDICGEPGRRKTAFAQALAKALDTPQVVYHDFTQPEPEPTPIVLDEEAMENPQPLEAPPSAIERALIESCAFSEAARTILILDQLQAADFRDQARLYQFIRSARFLAGATEVVANRPNFLLMLISEEPLYHSLARVSFRIWSGRSSTSFDYRPIEFGLGVEATALFDALAALFALLGRVPTAGELSRVLDDLDQRARTEEQLRASLFGWVEGLERGALYAPVVRDALSAVLAASRELLGEDAIELSDPDAALPS